MGWGQSERDRDRQTERLVLTMPIVWRNSGFGATNREEKKLVIHPSVPKIPGGDSLLVSLQHNAGGEKKSSAFTDRLSNFQSS